MRKAALLALCAALALPALASSATGRRDVLIGLLLPACKPTATTGGGQKPPKPGKQPKPKPQKQQPPFRPCNGSGTVAVGSLGQQPWRLSAQATATSLRGTLTLGRGSNHVVLGLASNVVGDWNGDGVTGTRTYTVRGGNGALKQAFAGAASKQVGVSAKISYTGLELKLDFTGLE